MMFARFDPATGKILSTGQMDKAHVAAEHAAGGAIVEITDHVVDLRRAHVDPVSGAVCYREPPAPPVAPELQTAIARAGAYPPLQDFADALYWRERGDVTKWLAWLAACDAVKARFPKSAQQTETS